MKTVHTDTLPRFRLHFGRLTSCVLLFLACPLALDAQDGGAFSDERPGRGAWRRRGGTGEDGAEFGGGFGRGRGNRGEFGAGRFGGAGRGLRRGIVEPASYAPLELHGIMGFGEDALVSITVTQTGESQWVPLRSRKAKWYVENINYKNRSVIVRMSDNTPLELKMIPLAGAGTPETVRPQSAQVVNLGAPAENTVGSSAQPAVSPVAAFDPKAIASQMVALRGSASPEQFRAFGEQMRSLNPEQRQQVFELLRAQRTGEGRDGAAPASARPATVRAPGAGGAAPGVQPR